MGILYLLPNLLGETSVEAVIPGEVVEVIKNIRVFATENTKNTRRFLKKIDKSVDIDSLVFSELNEHSSRQDVEQCLGYLEKENVGIISEAGCPGIADPGSELVALAHRKGFRVVPLVGPSSILLALIASGFSGQCFSFNGYLPVKNPERSRMLRQYEKQSVVEKRTQIFIETPYRNLKLFQEMLAVLQPATRLSIACGITTGDEYIKTAPVQEWKKSPEPEIDKKPAIFSIYAG